MHGTAARLPLGRQSGLCGAFQEEFTLLPSAHVLRGCCVSGINLNKSPAEQVKTVPACARHSGSIWKERSHDRWVWTTSSVFSLT